MKLALYALISTLGLAGMSATAYGILTGSLGFGLSVALLVFFSSGLAFAIYQTEDDL